MRSVWVDLVFCRHLLAQVKPRVQAAGKRIVRDAWVWCAGRNHWEFHGPDKFYWHGRAANAYDARYKGWCAWLERHRPDLVPCCDGEELE
jgi:hypothetical protein